MIRPGLVALAATALVACSTPPRPAPLDLTDAAPTSDAAPSGSAAGPLFYDAPAPPPTAPPPTAAAPGEWADLVTPIAGGGIAAADIVAAQRPLHPEVDACMEQLVHRRPPFEAGTTFQLDVDAAGAARAVRIAADDVNDHVFADCVSAVLRRVVWPTSKQKHATFAVRYTIRSSVRGAQPVAEMHMRSGWGDLFKPIPSDDYTVQQLLDAQQPLHRAVVACMGQLLTRRPKQNGVTTFAVAVDAAGATQGVRVSADDIGDATYTSCMTQVIASGRWPAPSRGRPTRFDLEYQVMGDPSRPPAP